MAEIKVEKKDKAPIWPWIIGILVLLGLIWFLVEAFEGDNDATEYEEVEVEDVSLLEGPQEKSEVVFISDPSRRMVHS